MDTIEKLERSIHELVEEYTSLRNDVKKTADETDDTFHKLEEARETIITLQKTIHELRKEVQRHKELETKKVLITKQIQEILDKLTTIDTLEKVTNA